MEEYAITVLYLILGFGCMFLLKKKLRMYGIVLIVISIVFLYLIPTLSFWLYKKKSTGTYSDSKGTEIIIYPNENYMVRYKGKITGEGKVLYNKQDSYHFTLDGYSEHISTSEDEIQNFNTGQIVFYKIK